MQKQPQPYKQVTPLAYLLLSIVLFAHLNVAADPPSAVELSTSYAVVPNLTYLKADNVELKLDVYTPREFLTEDAPTNPLPTVVYFHGGGWMVGSKERSALAVLPYLEKGWAAVNVQYRLGGVALAPAAVQDTRCAVWWVKRNAQRYGLDPDKIVLTGRSAGGHLALITGMLTADSGLDALCPDNRGGKGTDRALVTTPELNVAAIINWAGITDVNDLIDGPNQVSYATSWLGGLPDRAGIAKRVSPLTYVRRGIPPILTLHGDQDQVVPYAHAIRLHEALDGSGVTNQLYTITGKEHFNFTVDEVRKASAVIDAFLEEHL